MENHRGTAAKAVKALIPARHPAAFIGRAQAPQAAKPRAVHRGRGLLRGRVPAAAGSPGRVPSRLVALTSPLRLPKWYGTRLRPAAETRGAAARVPHQTARQLQTAGAPGEAWQPRRRGRGGPLPMYRRHGVTGA